MAGSERVENIGITAPLKNVSENNDTLHVLNTNNETRNNIPDKVSELSVPGTHFDRQPHTHHIFQFKKKHLCFNSAEMGEAFLFVYSFFNQCEIFFLL